MRRIALFSDIHGNLPALEAVLADIAARDLDAAYCLGDLVGYGPDPTGVVERVRVAGVPVVRGNYDDGIGRRAGGCGCYYATEQAKRDGAASYAFTDDALDEADHVWLAALPDAIRLEHEGARILLAHGSPRRINEYLLPDRTDAQLARLAEDAGADVVCVGHVHIPYHRVLTGVDGSAIHYVSSGSVGKPKDDDPRACWVEVVLGTKAEVNATCPDDRAGGPVGAPGGVRGWVGVLVHRVPYDVDAVVDAMREAGLPDTLGEALRSG